MITEKKYPILEWTSYRPDFLPENLHFAGFDQISAKFMATSKGFQNSFGLLGFDYFQGNTLEERIKKAKSNAVFQPHKHLYLSEKVFHKVDSDQKFRIKMWANRNTPSGSGSVMFKQGGFYMFRILNEKDSQTYAQAQNTNCKIEEGSRYFAVAHFVEDNFIGFEEGTILKNGNLQIHTEGHYHPMHEVGQYISFVSIALTAYFTDAVTIKKLNPNEGLNSTKQIINFLE